jgi:hypothetical protein
MTSQMILFATILFRQCHGSAMLLAPRFASQNIQRDGSVGFFHLATRVPIRFVALVAAFRNVHLVLSVHNGSAFLLAGFLGGRFSGFRWPVEFKNVFLIQGFALQGHDGFMRAHAMLADDQCSSV